MPWEKQYDETDVLERATRAFWACGYEATSMGDLVDATGVNRGSLYSAYAGKRDLFLAALAHYDRHYREEYLAALAKTHPPRKAILAAFAAAGGQGRGDRPPGCLLVNTALEMSPHDPEVRAFVQGSLDEVEVFFRDMVERGQRAGDLTSAAAPAVTAKALLGLFLGLRVMARAGISQETRGALVAQADALLDG